MLGLVPGLHPGTDDTASDRRRSGHVPSMLPLRYWTSAFSVAGVVCGRKTTAAHITATRPPHRRKTPAPAVNQWWLAGAGCPPLGSPAMRNTGT